MQLCRELVLGKLSFFHYFSYDCIQSCNINKYYETLYKNKSKLYMKIVNFMKII